jgi:hypothetical protein
MVQLLIPKITPAYLKQTDRLFQEAGKEKPMSLEVLTVIALLGLTDQMSEKDIKFGLKLIMELKKQNDPRWEFFFEEMRQVILKKGRKILQQKHFPQQQVAQDLKFLDLTLTKFKQNKKMELLKNLGRINKILKNLGLSL